MQDVKKYLTEKEQTKLKFLGLRKTQSLVRKSTKLFNQLCKDCKSKVLVNSRIPKEQYCKDCQKRAGELGF